MTYPQWIPNHSAENALTELLRACDSAIFRSRAPLPIGIDLAGPAQDSIPSPPAVTSAYTPAPLPAIEWPTQQPEFRQAPTQAVKPLESGAGTLLPATKDLQIDPLRPYGHRR